MTCIISRIKDKALSNLVTLKTLNALKILNILTVLKALTELPLDSPPVLALSSVSSA